MDTLKTSFLIILGFLILPTLFATDLYISEKYIKAISEKYIKIQLKVYFPISSFKEVLITHLNKLIFS